MADSLTNSNREDKGFEGEWMNLPDSTIPYLFKSQMNELVLDQSAIEYLHSQIEKIYLFDRTESVHSELFIHQLTSIQEAALEVISSFEEQKTAIIRHYAFGYNRLLKRCWKN